jgi:NTE family protein
MKSNRGCVALVVGLALISPINVWAQNDSSGERPKIGLVLAGGGAKGAAHVGVIKVLEELGVPIDYIAGTSMGAIVGGLYASGMSADELANAIRSIDWDDIFNDKPIRKDRDFRRKLDDEGFLIRYKLGFNDGAFTFPRGAIDGQKLNLVLRELSKRAIGIHDFDKLPIPFRAVAADIETGEPVAIGSGDLAKAMRASMAVSGIFPPVEIEGRLLVDGGLAKNLPMDVARKMGADILIVVNFPDQFRKRKELNSAVALVLQSLDLLIAQNSRLQLKTLRSDDILIVPALGDIGATSFDRAADAIPIGEKAARSFSSRLSKRIVPGMGRSGLVTSKLISNSITSGTKAARSQAPRLHGLSQSTRGTRPSGTQVDIKPIEETTLDFIRIENNSRLSDELISSRLSIKLGDKLDFDKLERDMAVIFGLDYFETVDYQVVIENDKTGIVVTATEKASGLDSFRFGLNLENDFDGDSSYNVSVRYQKEGINELGGELILQANVGEDLGAGVAFLQPLDPATRYFLTPAFTYSARDVPIFSNGSKTAEFRVSTAAFEFLVARQLANWGALSLGINRGWGWRDLNTGTTAPQEDDFDIGEVFGRVNYDTFDNLHFPNKGTRAAIEFRRSDDIFGGGEDFYSGKGRLALARTWSKNTVLGSFETGMTFDGTAPAQNLFLLGGFLNLSGFLADELSGQDFGVGRLVFYRNIGARPGSFGVTVYVGASLEAGNVWQDTDDMAIDDLIVAGSIFLGLDTPIGPLYVAYGHAEGGNNSAYLFLGQTF